MENLAAHHSKFSKRIFSRCLDMKYPDPDFVLTIESVMEYNMWPLILTSYGKYAVKSAIIDTTIIFCKALMEGAFQSIHILYV